MLMLTDSECHEAEFHDALQGKLARSLASELRSSQRIVFGPKITLLWKIAEQEFPTV